jgi:transcriptional regulator with XRE-family HTH domain
VETSEQIEPRIAKRLAQLRAERQWSLEELSERTGISRASLSRLERSELSPTAAMLGRLCTAFGWTLSRLMAEAEAKPANLVAKGAQTEWTDPESGYRRRAISPPTAGLRGEVVEVRIPPGASVSFDTSPVHGLEHHLWIIEGSLNLDVEGSRYELGAGDCLRYILKGPTRFENKGRKETRYIVAMVHP